MTDPLDREPRLLKTRVVYALQAETQISWLGEDKQQVVLAKLRHRLPKTAGAVARPVPDRPGYLTVEMPAPPAPPLLIVYRYTASLKVFHRVWEIAGLVFPTAIEPSNNRPRSVAALLK
jgi:hypothetical protein